MDAFTARMKELSEDIFEIHRMFVKSLPGFQIGQNGVLLVISLICFLSNKIHIQYCSLILLRSSNQSNIHPYNQ